MIAMVLAHTTTKQTTKANKGKKRNENRKKKEKKSKRTRSRTAMSDRVISIHSGGGYVTPSY